MKLLIGEARLLSTRISSVGDAGKFECRDEFSASSGGF